jgi:hypothetical protein
MPTPADEALYAKVKAKIYRDMPKHSAYRSALLVKTYKAAFTRKHKTTDAYLGKKPTKTGLKRWLNEEWRNQRGEVGYKYKSDVYRPTKRITAKTPTTFKELSAAELRIARNAKLRTGRVKRFREK